MTAKPKQISRYGITEDDGTVLREWPRHVILIGVPNELETLQAQAERMAFTLGY